jgi:hypothetical protein
MRLAKSIAIAVAVLFVAGFQSAASAEEQAAPEPKEQPKTVKSKKAKPATTDAKKAAPAKGKSKGIPDDSI